ncbi:MAG: hypothetical protein OEY33_07705, partial [Bdellovibrionales bacterium]|nr:hypothetical protein [Bdellovibrionales bacterium]
IEFLNKIATEFKYNIKEWLNIEKNILLEASKTLLSSIRHLTTQGSENNFNDFTYSLDNLLSSCEDDSLASIALLIFRSYIENLEAKNPKENIEKVEVVLYDLKKSFQKISLGIREIEETVESIRKNDLVMGREKTSLLDNRL